jgi:crossover junction endodeoxyribonuclease RusA
VKLELPFPPSTNTYYRKVGHKMLLSKKGRQYKDNVYAAVLDQQGLFKPLLGPLKITVILIPPDKRKRDLDNFAGKALYDALAHSNVFMDDSQIKESHNYMLEPGGEGMCSVVIEEQ